MKSSRFYILQKLFDKPYIFISSCTHTSPNPVMKPQTGINQLNNKQIKFDSGGYVSTGWTIPTLIQVKAIQTSAEEHNVNLVELIQ